MPTELLLSEEEIRQLKYERYTYSDILVQKRLFAIYLLLTTNLSHQSISQVVGCHRKSIGNWLAICREEGLSGLYQSNYRKPESALLPVKELILEDLDRHPVQSINQACARIKELTGIDLKPTAVRDFLIQHGYRCRKMGQIPAKADPEKQKQWVAQDLTPYIDQAKRGLCHLLFCDAAHFVLGAFLCMVWSRTRIFLKTAAGRNRINVLGAVNAISKEITTHINTTYINADTILLFLKQLREQYSELPIIIVLDNARYQHCQVVKDMAEKLNITLLFLPAYSPNLNIIERLWKFTKKEILYAQYYDTPAKFHEAIRTFFSSVNDKYQKKLESLLTLEFQFFDTQNGQNLAA